MTPNPKRTAFAINPALVHRQVLKPEPACCPGYAPGERHKFGCRFWSELVDHEAFYLETEVNGFSIGNHINGAHRLGRELIRLAGRKAKFQITVLASFGSKPLEPTAFVVKSRRF